ncbi:outer membrane protein [Persicirhabdus sediminis]|uniref:Outer membrane protein beta-barrel domain-containing protein n=1 Tax=Persicirhabdus sediminis TaxID=454144 RepID=A0A8J7MC98_9BACT|nr:hypothetical protein [Persicirhabdus sediminis]MBK1790386.1 hypothetical protein [Persicirhabdus sediminis]
MKHLMMGAMALCAVGVQSVVADDMLVEPTPTSVDKRSQPASVNDMLVPSLDDTRIDYLELRKDGGWFTSASVGNMFDTQEAYFTLSLGYHLDEKSSLSLQLMRFKDNGTGMSSHYEVTNKLYQTSIGISYQRTEPLTETLNWYYGGGIGAAYLESDLTMSSMFFGKFYFDDSSWSAYADAKVGIEKMINQNLSVQLGARMYYINDNDFDYDLGEFTGKFNNVYFGLELGVSYSF